MEHTHLVTASELDEFSRSTLSEGVIPELVWLLVSNSAEDISECRIPYGDSIGLPGLDGLVTTEGGYRQFIPKGTSYWEIGTGNKPGVKATADYKKRTINEKTKLSLEEISQATYVFLTSHSKAWPSESQKTWKSKRTSHGWKEVKVIDGVLVADWLREFPAIAKWLLKKMGNVSATTGYLTVAEHWNLIPQSDRLEDPKLPAALFLLGREQVCEEVSKLFVGEIDQLIISVESAQDVEDFISAFIESQSPELTKGFINKCLFINTHEAWDDIVNLKSSHILVASPNLGIDKNSNMHIAAKRNGHRVIIPIAGSWPNGNEKIPVLRSPKRSQIQKVLSDNGFSPDRANELADKGNLSTLKRYLRGLGDIPTYATWENANLLNMLNLVGQFYSNNHRDVEVLESLLGKPKGEWIDDATNLSLKQDTPLYHYSEKWKVNSRLEVWQVLGARLTKDDLDRFSAIAIEVLSKENPKFLLERDKLHTAHFYGVGHEESDLIREGIAETVALLGAKCKALVNLPPVIGEFHASKIVTTLLKNADWKVWASLNLLLPMLAEAAPDAFLEAVDSLLAYEPSPFLNLFALEDSGIFGGNYISGLLWALETLAWSPDYIILATRALGNLAAIDPGGTWGNRPKNSLAEIFLPWHFQTNADLEKRLAALKNLERVSPKVCAQLLIRILPTPHDTASGTRKPLWREYAPRPREMSVAEYSNQINVYFDMALRLANENLDLLESLVGKFGLLPEDKVDALLEYLNSTNIQNLDSAQRNSLWNKITKLTNNHRRHSEQSWAMSLELIERIENTLPLIVDNAYVLNAKRLFSVDDFRNQEFDESYNETFPQVELQRISKVCSLLETNTIEEVIEFGRSCEAPFKVGFALGALRRSNLDPIFVNENTQDEVMERMKLGYLSGRFWFKGPDWSWVDSTILKFQSETTIVNLLIKVDFDQHAWERVSKLSEHSQSIYWKKCNPNVWNLGEKDILYVLEKFSTHKRYSAGVTCLYVMVFKKIEVPFELAKNILLKTDPGDEEVKSQLDQHYLTTVIKALQKSADKESYEDMLHIEWNYLPLLDKFNDAQPIYLEQKLADEPEFFSEIVSIVFKSDKGSDEEPVTEQRRQLANHAYRLLNDWSVVPGTSREGDFDGEKFKAWIEQVKKITKVSGHYDIAMEKFGQILHHSPPDPSGLWIHRSIAEVLDERGADDLRSGFNVGLFNKRGVFTHTSGVAEMKLANKYFEQAKSLDDDFPWLAKSIRALGKEYESDSMRESRSDDF